MIEIRHVDSRTIYHINFSHEVYQGINRLFKGTYAGCAEFVHQHREQKIRKHRMQRRRNKLYRLHPEWDRRNKGNK